MSVSKKAEAIHSAALFCVLEFMLFEMFIIHLQHLIVGRFVCRKEWKVHEN